jgi:transcription initiation factor IIE alpha subunit
VCAKRAEFCPKCEQALREQDRSEPASKRESKPRRTKPKFGVVASRGERAKT